MTKLILNFSKIIVILLTTLFFSSCNFHIDGLNTVEGSKIVKTEKRTVSESFTHVEAATGLEVEIIQQENFEITVIADDNLHEHIATNISNGYLEIKSDRSIRNAKSKKVIVGIPYCEGISTSSGASLYAKSKLKGDKIELSTSSGSGMNLILEYDEINGDSSSGSELNISGINLNARFDASSGSTINAEKLISNHTTANSSSGSSIAVHPVVSLDADASSGSSIRYYKTPQKINSNKSSGGSVSLH